MPLVPRPTLPSATVTRPADAAEPSPQSIVAVNDSTLAAAEFENPASVNVPTCKATSKPVCRTFPAGTVNTGGALAISAATSSVAGTASESSANETRIV